MGFDSFLGNVKAVGTVRTMLAHNRVPGAILFTGPEGVGKKTLAVMLAKAMNCERRAPGGDDFCGACAHCRKADEMLRAALNDIDRRRGIKDAQRRVEGLMYFDFQLIEPITRYILVEQIRQLRQVAFSRPFELSHRILIINEAQTIHWQAIDLLLKVLEEPPETTTFVLVCSNSRELRPTIRSRCLRVQFTPVEGATIVQLLAEEKQLSKNQQMLKARLAAGSIAKAKELDLGEFERLRRPWLEFLASIAGKGPPASVPPNWKVLFDSTKILTESRDTFEETLKIGSTLLRDLLVTLIEPEAERSVTNLDILGSLKTWSARLGLSGIERLSAGLEQAHRLQIRNVNQQLSLDALAIDLVKAR